MEGHAIECRLNAEDIHNDFRPAPGRVTLAWFPSLTGLRVDTHLQPGAMIPPHYDSMIAKLVAWGETRDHAIETMQKGLRVCALGGVKTNMALHRAIMADPRFRKGGVDTNYLGGILPNLVKEEGSE